MAEIHYPVLAIILSILGNCLSSFVALSPLPRFFKLDKERDPGPYSIYPMVALCGNSYMWVIYGMITKTFAVLPVNMIGLFSTIYFIVVHISTLKELKERRIITGISMGMAIILSLFTEVVILSTSDVNLQTNIMGYACNAILFCFFGAPLMALYGVIKSKDTSSMNLLLLICSGVAAIVWTGYGLLVHDLFITVPNAVGATLTMSQLAIYKAINIFYPHGNLRSGEMNIMDIDKETPLNGADDDSTADEPSAVVY
ncbi:hypothetical protein SAMD00019534_039440, partial [Acytostelium subglobosum LB1]|uniref:hypothetical protein n=1 Tax=Acytostelium subglobosum LB1 TaxID=1410327 RepID=UPI0006450B6D